MSELSNHVTFNFFRKHMQFASVGSPNTCANLAGGKMGLNGLMIVFFFEHGKCSATLLSIYIYILN